jgi:hypothetical protein
MADDITIKIEGDVKAYLESVGLEVDKEMVTALMQAAVHAEGELKQAIAELFKKGGTGGLACNPKAVLLQTKGGNVKSSGAFLDLVQARIQDEGGTIRAKSVKNLAIPLTAQAKVPGKWPRAWPKGSGPDKLHFLKSKSGNKLLVEDKAGGGFTPHYVLKESVQIHGKGYVERARRSAEKTIADIMSNHVGFAIKRAKTA